MAEAIGPYAEQIERFAESLDEKSPKTRRAYLWDAERYIDYLIQEGIDLSDSNPETVSGFISAIDINMQTAMRRVSAINGLLGSLGIKKVRRREISETLHHLAPGTHTQTISKEEYQRLIEASMNVVGLFPERIVAAESVIYRTGAQLENLLRLTPNDLRIYRLEDIAVVHIDFEKTGIKRPAFSYSADGLENDVLSVYLDSLKDFLRTEEIDNLPLIPNKDKESMDGRSLRRHMKRASEKAELGVIVTPDVLRKSFIRNQHERGYKTVDISKFLGVTQNAVSNAIKR